MNRHYSRNQQLITEHLSLLRVVFFVAVVTVQAAFADCVPATSSLIGWWPGDGNANNVFGTNNGTLQGGATASTPGLAGTAFNFDGTNGSVQVPNSALLRPTNLTIETWVKFASLDSAGSGGSPAGDQYVVFRQNTRSSDFEGFDLSKTRFGVTDVFRFLIVSASAQKVEIHSSTTISTGAWYHLAAVRGSNFVQLYVNGALERQTNIAFPQDYGNFPLYFGTSEQGAWDHKLKGNLDEVSFYSRALSSNEIAAIYSAGAGGKCKAPGITSPPQSATVFSGSNVTFNVSATGFGTLAYQWRSNGVAINGATGTTLALSNVQLGFSADYTVVVTNLLGSTTSAVATLTVIPQPSVIVSVDIGDGGFGPKTGPAAIGQDASDYWNNLPGAGSVLNAKTARGNTTQTGVSVPYGINNWLLPYAASGDPMVDDYLGWTGGISPVTVNQLPSGVYDFYVYSHDSDIQLWVGSTSYGIKNAYEGIPLSHPPIWQENRQYVAFRNVAVTNGGSAVSISVGHVHQQDGIISGLQIVCNGPWILQSPSNAIVAVSSNLVLQVSGEAAPAPAYQWFFNGNPLANGGRISGATSNTLIVSSAQVADAGNYFVVLTNAGGAVTSSMAAVQVGFPPASVQAPSNQTNLVGTTAHFTAVFSGDQPMGFQWYFNGNPLADDARHSGSTSTNLSITAISEADAGNYNVVATNVFGVSASAVASLTVLVPATILSQPANQYVLTNGGAAFAVGVKGDEPLSFLWFFGATSLSDGGRFGGTTTRTLTIQNVQSNDLGGYQVVVSNAWGSATSSVATLNFATPRYVNMNSPSPAAPYLSWATAATVIQNAIDSANVGDWIFVTNGTYQTGGGVVKTNQGNKVLNRVAAAKPLTIRSVNGPAVTTIRGGAQVRCVYLTNGASISGFTLSGGSLNFNNPGYNDWDGAGVLSDDPAGVVVSNCVVQGNSGPYGGGANRVTLVNCLVAGNSAAGQGGGAYVCTLINCTVTGNNANYGGGMGWCMVTNSIVFFNSSSPFTPTNHFNTSFVNSCTTPDPGGTGNITSPPIFINAAAGNYRLQSNSPCVNAGMSLLPLGSVDLDGLPRIVDGVVDMGAYEYQHFPFILTQPTNQSVLIFSNVLFAVSTLGDEPLSYTWQKDGLNLVNDARITGATSASLSISNLAAQDAGGYRVIVTNVTGSVTSVIASLTILGPPSISSQPASRTVPAGTNVSFSVSASGLATLYYQWRFNQAELPAKTNFSLSLTNVQSANAGDYDVVITNIYGALTSSVATLTVLPAAPIITTQAVSRVGSVGQTIVFNVAAKGSEPMICQWQFNGNDLPGASGFALTLQNVNASYAGTYRAAVTNAAGFAFGTNVTLVVSPVLVWGRTVSSQPGGIAPPVSLPATATNVIAMVAGGSTDNGLPCMALRADGSIITWGYNLRDQPAPTNAVDVVNISVGTSGGTANNIVLRSDSNVINWTGSTKPPLPAPLTNGNFVAVAAGSSHQLALRDDGIVFAWGSNTFGQTNVPLSATNVVAIAAGANHSLALRADGTVIGWGVNSSATALNSASNVVMISAGGDQSMALRSDGTVLGRIVTNTSPNLLFGSPPSDATNMMGVAAGSRHSLGLRSDHTVTGWGQTNFGSLNIPAYATNVLAIAAGGDDSLALVPDPFAPPILPRIGRPPISRALTTGQNALMNALAIGGLPLRYQWYRNGTLLVGRTNQWLAFTNCQPGDAGNYQLAAINDFGSVTSAVASVTVAIPQPALKSPLKNGQSLSFTLDTINGVLYISEFQNGLAPGNWTEFDRRLGIGGSEVIADTNALPQTRFYRVRAIYPPPP